MLRAEILAEGVRDELPQPLVKARSNKPILVHIAVHFPSPVFKYKSEINPDLLG